MIGEERCVEADSSKDDELSLSLNSFWILFLFTGGTTTCSLAIYTLDVLRKAKTSQVEYITIVTTILKYWRHQRSRFSRKISDVENSDLPNA